MRTIQRDREAEKIRDELLQESFTIRRSLELSLAASNEIAAKKEQDWLKNLEKFHHFLNELSDRLYPPYIDESLPLAIQYRLESWQKFNSQLRFEMELPADWRHESSDRSLIILMILDDLMGIILSKILTEILIHVSLKLQKDISELKVQIFHPDSDKFFSKNGSEDLEYLRQCFRFLTSGRSWCQQKDITVVWYFRWRSQ